MRQREESRVIGWGQILYGALLSAIAAGLLLAVVLRGRHRLAIATAALSAAAGPIAWNAILRAANGVQFFPDAALVVDVYLY